MNPANLDDLLKIVPNKYLLTMVIAARAKQLEQGAERLVEYDSTNSLDIAIKEIAAGLIDVEKVIAQSNEIMERQFLDEDIEIEEETSVVEDFVDM